MLRTKYLTLAGCAVAALAFTGTMPATAASSMCKDGMMVSSDDAMMEDDGMMEEDSMMANDDAMMEEDSMMAEGDAMMEEDSMMAEGEMAHDDAMGEDTMSDDMMAHDGMKGEYTVQTGDSLFSIAEAQLCDGDRFPELIAANADVLEGATMLQPGMVLTIPGD